MRGFTWRNLACRLWALNDRRTAGIPVSICLHCICISGLFCPTNQNAKNANPILYNYTSTIAVLGSVIPKQVAATRLPPSKIGQKFKIVSSKVRSFPDPPDKASLHQVGGAQSTRKPPASGALRVIFPHWSNSLLRYPKAFDFCGLGLKRLLPTRWQKWPTRNVRPCLKHLRPSKQLNPGPFQSEARQGCNIVTKSQKRDEQVAQTCKPRLNFQLQNIANVGFWNPL